MLCILLPTDSSMAEQFSVRLVDEDGNTDTSHGNVQVMHLGLWGSVYDTYWQFSDANVCRQLNYAYALRATRCVSRNSVHYKTLFCVQSFIVWCWDSTSMGGFSSV